MKHAQLLMQLYIYGLKEENRILRRKLAETIVERDALTAERDDLLKEREERRAIDRERFRRAWAPYINLDILG
jgi:FtsZ-binding cell division protein ZapB